MTLSVDRVNGNIYFKSGETRSTQGKVIPPPEEKSNGAALLLGSLAALAIGGGIYIATRGKRTSTSSLSEAATQSVTPTENFKDMTIDAFKKAGNRFEKGRATLANGNRFVGKLTQKTEDGSTLIFEYDTFGDHIVTKIKEGKIVSKKSYHYVDNKLEFVRDATKAETDPNATLLTKSGSKIFTREYYISKNTKKGLLIIDSRDGSDTRYYKYDLSDKKYKLESVLNGGKIIFYCNDGKTKRFTLGDEIILYDKDGKETRRYARDSEEAKRFYDIFKQITGKYHSQ